MEASDVLRIENQLLKLTDAVSKLLVYEERQNTQALTLTAHTSALATATEAIRALDRRLDMWINRGMGAWAVVGISWTIYKTLA